jgi:hypothetical protein
MKMPFGCSSSNGEGDGRDLGPNRKARGARNAIVSGWQFVAGVVERIGDLIVD